MHSCAHGLELSDQETGTRSQVVILVRKDGSVFVTERQAWKAQEGQDEPTWSGESVQVMFKLHVDA